MKIDVAVIGGGLHGCSAALHLARRGVKVLVIEKDYVARHASGVNAGGVRRLGRDLAEVPIAAAATELWQHIDDLVDDDCGFEASGQLKVAENESELECLRARVRLLREHGFEHEVLIESEKLRELAPAIAPHCVGALYVQGDGHANPYRTTQAFKRKAQALGVIFREGCAVDGISRHGEVWRLATPAGVVAAPVLVNCAGAWGDKIAAALGEPVPLVARAPMLLITARLPPFLDPVVGAAGRALSFKQFDNGTVLVGGGYTGRTERAHNKTTLDWVGLAENARTAAELFPIMRAARVVRCWAGIEGYLPDNLPVIGPSQRYEQAYHAFGFSAHGFQLGPAVGGIIADLVTVGHSNLPIAPFCISRFNA